MLEPGNTSYLYAVLLYIWIEFSFEILKFQVITLKTVRTLIGITTPSTLCFQKKREGNLQQNTCFKFYSDAQYLVVTKQKTRQVRPLLTLT